MMMSGGSFSHGSLFPVITCNYITFLFNKRVLLVIFEIGTYVTRAHHITEDDTGLP